MIDHWRYGQMAFAALVSLCAAYVVFATDGRRGRAVAMHLHIGFGRVRLWFVAVALAFLALFLDTFARSLPPTAVTEGLSMAALFTFYGFIGFVGVDAVHFVAHSRHDELAAEHAAEEAAQRAQQAGQADAE